MLRMLPAHVDTDIQGDPPPPTGAGLETAFPQFPPRTGTPELTTMGTPWLTPSWWDASFLHFLLFLLLLLTGTGIGDSRVRQRN